eukprot:244353_1
MMITFKLLPLLLVMIPVTPVSMFDNYSYHPYRLMMHPALKIVDIEGKGQGIIVTEPVSFGQALIIEYPLINDVDIETGDDAESYYRQTRFAEANQKGVLGEHAKQRWHNLAVNSNFQQDPPLSRNQLKIQTNSVSNHVYGVISKINHGYPTTVELDIDLQKGRALVFATDDLANGTELVWDYCNLLHPQESWNEIHKRAKKHNIYLNESSRAMQHIKRYHHGLGTGNHLEESDIDNLAMCVATGLDQFYRNGVTRILFVYIQVIMNKDYVRGQRFADWYLGYSNTNETRIIAKHILKAFAWEGTSSLLDIRPLPFWLKFEELIVISSVHRK